MCVFSLILYFLLSMQHVGRMSLFHEYACSKQLLWPFIIWLAVVATLDLIIVLQFQSLFLMEFFFVLYTNLIPVLACCHCALP